MTRVDGWRPRVALIGCTEAPLAPPAAVRHPAIAEGAGMNGRGIQAAGGWVRLACGLITLLR